MNVLQQTKQWLAAWGLDDQLIQPTAVVATFLLLMLLVILSYWLARRLLLQAVHRLVKRSRTKWDDVLMRKRFFSYLAHLVPAVVLQTASIYFFPQKDWLEILILRVTNVYMVLMVILVFFALLSTVEHFLSRSEGLRDQPIGSYFQLSRIVLGVIGGILMLSLALDKSPLFFLSTFGAMTAIILLVFRDTILGFVASIQIAANDMVHLGDWVEMPKYGADGSVIAITLATIKVRNWDHTISNLPTYAFISDSFKNWQAMKRSGGRRIMRALYLRIGSIRLCTPEDLARYRRIQLISAYLDQRSQEIDQYNRERNLDQSILINGRNLTNVGIFREYATQYLRQHPGVHQRADMLLMVRQLEPTEHGLPLQVYCFTNTTVWAEYESIQSDIFDHLLTAASWFDLELFERPSSADMRAWGQDTTPSEPEKTTAESG
jgi:miniconductance mechanosensitive channel